MKSKNKQPHILINIATHGDEYIGFDVKKSLKGIQLKKGILEFNVANEKASRLGKRYIDQDLNRSFPGNKEGNHEERIAANLLPKIKKADVVIDIHSTTSELRDAPIVTKLDKKTQELISKINPKYLLYMKVTGNKALISGAKIGIAFEYGKEKDRKVVLKIRRDINRILAFYGMVDMRGSNTEPKTVSFKIETVFPKVQGAKLHRSIRNYCLVKKGQLVAVAGKVNVYAKEDFYPILFGNSNYEKIFGFVGKVIK